MVISTLNDANINDRVKSHQLVTLIFVGIITSTIYFAPISVIDIVISTYISFRKILSFFILTSFQQITLDSPIID